MSLKNKEFKEGNLAVYVMTHSPECTWLDDYCIPMDLGAAKRDNLRYATRDDEGDDNISEKNGLYNELTGLYWMWKNEKHEYIGLFHYRRIFTHINRQTIPSILDKYDFIVAKPWVFKSSIEMQYCNCHYKSDWNIMLEELNQLYPDYYNTAIKVFSESVFVPCNMFISTKQHMENYCAWLFPLLENIENRLDFSDGRTEYNKRVIAFMGERLFTLYLLHNNYRLKYAQMLLVPPHFPIYHRCPKLIVNMIYSNIYLYNKIIYIQNKSFGFVNHLKKIKRNVYNIFRE